MVTGSFAVLPRYFSSMRSPSLSPCDSASRGLTHAVGSHVILVSGFGSSCSQPLLAKRPSQMVGSGLKIISSPDPLGLWALGVGLWDGGADSDTPKAEGPEPKAWLCPAAAVPGTKPSCNTCFQNVSVFLNGAPLASVIVKPPTWPPCARVQ